MVMTSMIKSPWLEQMGWKSPVITTTFVGIKPGVRIMLEDLGAEFEKTLDP